MYMIRFIVDLVADMNMRLTWGLLGGGSGGKDKKELNLISID